MNEPWLDKILEINQICMYPRKTDNLKDTDDDIIHDNGRNKQLNNNLYKGVWTFDDIHDMHDKQYNTLCKILTMKHIQLIHVLENNRLDKNLIQHILSYITLESQIFIKKREIRKTIILEEPFVILDIEKPVEYGYKYKNIYQYFYQAYSEDHQVYFVDKSLEILTTQNVILKTLRLPCKFKGNEISINNYQNTFGKIQLEIEFALSKIENYDTYNAPGRVLPFFNDNFLKKNKHKNIRDISNDKLNNMQIEMQLTTYPLTKLHIGGDNGGRYMKWFQRVDFFTKGKHLV